jgi:hypothetical protein
MSFFLNYYLCWCVDVNVVHRILLIYLAMNNSCNGEIPSCVSCHSKSKERPNTVIVEGWYEHSCSTTCSKDICPSSFVQVVIYVVDVAVSTNKNVRIVVIIRWSLDSPWVWQNHDVSCDFDKIKMLSWIVILSNSVWFQIWTKSYLDWSQIYGRNQGKKKSLPCTSYKLNHRSKEKESTIES